jgi:hypothetical protein
MAQVDRKLGRIGKILLILPILGSILQTILGKILQSPFWGDGWGAARLSPTFAMLFGYSLYAPIDDGAVLNTVYAPLTYLVYLPAVLFSDISSAIIVATAIAASFFLIPVFLIIVQRNSIFCSLILFAAFCLFALYSAPLEFSGFSIHADAPALGFGGLAAWMVNRAVIRTEENGTEPNWQNYLASSIFAVAAVWTKQTMLPILFAIPFYLWFWDKKAALAYSKFLVICLLAISLVLILAFEPKNMFYNIITIPAAHPWRSLDRFQILGSALGELIQSCAIPLTIFLFYGIVKWKELAELIRTYSKRDSTNWTSSSSKNRSKNWAKSWSKDWIVVLIIAIFLIPTTLLGRVKVGGVENTLSPTIYFLAIASLLVIKEVVLNSSRKLWRSLIFSGVLAIVTAATLIQTLPFNYLSDLKRSLPNNPQAVAYRYAKDHAGEVYFPFNPLSHLFAEGKLYHFHYGLFDRQLAGDRLTDAHFYAHIPNKLKFVAFPPKFPSRDLRKSPPMQYLRQFSQKISLPELPEWTIFTPPEKVGSDSD